MTRKERSDIKRKLDVINYPKRVGNINKACRHYGVSRTIYFKWLKKYQEKGENGPINKKPGPENLKFSSFTSRDGKNIKRYQYTAIDDATRIRAL